MKELDKQFSQWEDMLTNQVKIPVDICSTLASTIQNEIKQLSADEIEKIESASPVGIDLRVEELLAFQSMMDTFNKMKPKPEIVRTQVIAQNYICFVYLKDTLFERLKRVLPTGSVGKKCCKFLLNNPVRAFRNSIAHGNWKYTNDFSGIEFWAYKGEPDGNPMPRWEVSQNDLGFWQALSRMIAYVTYLTLVEMKTAHNKS